LGGYDIRMYVSLYPSEVAGMVFVDSAHPDQCKQCSAKVRQFNDDIPRQWDMHGRTMPFGIPRFRDGVEQTHVSFGPWSVPSNANLKTIISEVHDEWADVEEDTDQIRTTASLRNMPLAVAVQRP
jgi:pimeloyl-ACP methyl ester carboxylesterase